MKYKYRFGLNGKLLEVIEVDDSPRWSNTKW